MNIRFTAHHFAHSISHQILHTYVYKNVCSLVQRLDTNPFEPHEFQLHAQTHAQMCCVRMCVFACACIHVGLYCTSYSIRTSYSSPLLVSRSELHATRTYTHNHTHTTTHTHIRKCVNIDTCACACLSRVCVHTHVSCMDAVFLTPFVGFRV